MLLVTATVAAVFGTGCGPTCKELRSSYESARAAEMAAGETSSDGERTAGASGRDAGDADRGSAGPQFAVGVRTRFVERRADDLAAAAIESFVSAARSLDVAGTSAVGVSASPQVRNFRLERASDTCGHCFRLRGELDGSLSVEIPILGTRSVPLEGRFDFVAPVDVEPGDESGGALILDLGEAARHNAAPIAVSVADLRKSWRQTIDSLLSTQLADELFDNLQPVTIVEFRTPNFGLDGLEVRPTGIRLSEEGDVVAALFSSSIPAADAPGGERLAEAARPADGRSAAVAFPQRFVVSALAYGFRKDSVPRRYSPTGRPAPDGPVRITLRDFRIAAGETSAPESNAASRAIDSDPNGLRLALDFRAFHLSDADGCYWFDGTASGSVSVVDSEMRLGLDRVEFTDTSRSDLALDAANWAAARFVRAGSTIARASLDGENLAFPGGDLQFDALKLRTKHGIVTVSAVRSDDL